MIRWFKRRKPSHRATVAPDIGDIHTAYAWGLTLTEWYALTDFERATCRRTVTTAPRFKVEA